ncbi:MAG: hypothetical protein KY444_08170 [Gemmatimonadetes bacterium]|nr:hypothetical protein [Gemmatimonadota bacterium]
MSNPLARLFPRLVDRRSSVEAITPRRTFQDVVLPPVTTNGVDPGGRWQQAVAGLRKRLIAYYNRGK